MRLEGEKKAVVESKGDANANHTSIVHVEARGKVSCLDDMA